MIHHYDHRWATYEGRGDELITKDVGLDDKQNIEYEPNTRYWVPETEVVLRSSRIHLV